MRTFKAIYDFRDKHLFKTTRSQFEYYKCASYLSSHHHIPSFLSISDFSIFEDRNIRRKPHDHTYVGSIGTFIRVDNERQYLVTLDDGKQSRLSKRYYSCFLNNFPTNTINVPIDETKFYQESVKMCQFLFENCLDWWWPICKTGVEEIYKPLVLVVPYFGFAFKNETDASLFASAFDLKCDGGL